MIYVCSAVILPATECLDYCGIMNRIGEIYLAPDGFNVCFCGEKGPKCTTNICPGKGICYTTGWFCEDDILINGSQLAK